MAEESLLDFDQRLPETPDLQGKCLDKGQLTITVFVHTECHATLLRLQAAQQACSSSSTS